MEIITSYNPKGGVAKSTSAINLAAINAEKARTLYIDLDNNRSGSMMLNLSEQESYDENKTSELLFSDNPSKASELAVPSSFGFDFIPAGYDMSRCERMLASSPGGLMHLAFLFQEDEALQEYDKIFLDCAGWAGEINNSALYACTGLLVPVDTSGAAVAQIDRIFETVNTIQKLQTQTARKAFEILGFFLVRISKQTNVADEVIEKMVNHPLAMPHFLSEAIPSSTEVEKAVLAGKPVVQNNPKHVVSVSYRNLYKTIWGEK